MERQSFFKARSNVLIFLVISLRQGGVLILGTVKRVMLTGSKVCGVQVDDYELPADAVLIALGPWSNHARSWFPKANLPDIYGMRAHSVVVRMPQAPPLKFKLWPRLQMIVESPLKGSIKKDGTV